MSDGTLITVASGEKYWRQASYLAESAARFGRPLEVITHAGERPPERIAHRFAAIHDVIPGRRFNHSDPVYAAWELKRFAYEKTPDHERAMFVDADSLCVRDPFEAFERLDHEAEILTPGARTLKPHERWAVPVELGLSTAAVAAWCGVPVSRPLQTLNGGFLAWQRGRQAADWFGAVADIYATLAARYEQHGLTRIWDELVFAISFARMEIRLPGDYQASTGIWDAPDARIDFRTGATCVQKGGYWLGKTFRPPIVHYGHKAGSAMYREHVEAMRTADGPVIPGDGWTISQAEARWLTDYAERLAARDVVEVGPGISTVALRRAGCRVDTIETETERVDQAAALFADDRGVSILSHEDLDGVEGTSDAPAYALGFVDGPPGVARKMARRDACRTIAALCDRWLLHDADRDDERAILDEFAEEVDDDGRPVWRVRSVDGFPKLAEVRRIATMPKVACICVTFNRPHLLPEAIQAFRNSDYSAERRELIILDDAGQYASQSGDGWRLVSERDRYPTLGDKRNAAHGLAGDADIYVIWDDDDICLPAHIDGIVDAVEAGADYVRQTEVYSTKAAGRIVRGPTRGAYVHAGGFTRAAFEAVGGYPSMDTGQDQALYGRFKKAMLREGFAIASRPTYVYRWGDTHSAHLSAMKDGYVKRGAETIEPVETVEPFWSRDWPEVVRERT